MVFTRLNCILNYLKDIEKGGISLEKGGISLEKGGISLEKWLLE